MLGDVAAHILVEHRLGGGIGDEGLERRVQIELRSGGGSRGRCRLGGNRSGNGDQGGEQDLHIHSLLNEPRFNGYVGCLVSYRVQALMVRRCWTPALLSCRVRCSGTHWLQFLKTNIQIVHCRWKSLPHREEAMNRTARFMKYCVDASLHAGCGEGASLVTQDIEFRRHDERGWHACLIAQ